MPASIIVFANGIALGKRAMHTLNCDLVTRDGEPVIIGGTPGGDFQPPCSRQPKDNPTP